MIRRATHDDLDAIIELGACLHAESPRWSRIGYDPIKARSTMAAVIESDQLLLVAEKDGRIVGGVAALVAPHWASQDLVGQELSLFVHPDERGAIIAAALIRRMRQWAQARGARFLTAGTSTGVDPERTAELYECCGFQRSVIGLEVDYGH